MGSAARWRWATLEQEKAKERLRSTCSQPPQEPKRSGRSGTGYANDLRAGGGTLASETTRPARDAYDLPDSGRTFGNRITSRIDGESVRIIVTRSTPIPIPPAGGIPCSRA